MLILPLQFERKSTKNISEIGSEKVLPIRIFLWLNNTKKFNKHHKLNKHKCLIRHK